MHRVHAHAPAFVDNTVANVVNCSELAEQAFLHTLRVTDGKVCRRGSLPRVFLRQTKHAGCFNTRFAYPDGHVLFPSVNP